MLYLDIFKDTRQFEKHLSKNSTEHVRLQAKSAHHTSITASTNHTRFLKRREAGSSGHARPYFYFLQQSHILSATVTGYNSVFICFDQFTDSRVW